MTINFKYPSFAIGTHSGWNEINNSPTTSLSLTKRIPVNLRKSSYEKVFLNTDKEIPYAVKSAKGDISGLSSGAGSSIVEFHKIFFKIKRNGYRNKGFIDKQIPDREFIVKDTLFEETDNEVGGAMSDIDAQREIKIENELIKKGFLIPQRIVGLYKIKTPFEKEDAVAIIQKIDTDFRADELTMIYLFNLFFDVYGNKCSFSLKDNSFNFPQYSIKKGFQIFKKHYSKLFFELARNIGSIYRKFHDEGYLRGISNSWYGNELICEDGNIGVCDLESCFSREEINDNEIFEELAKTDYNLAITAFYDSMNCFENSLASIVGSKLVEGFREGYNGKEYKKLDIDIIKDQIKKFIKNREKIIKDD